MKVHIYAKYTDKYIYSGYAFVDNRGKVVNGGCVCSPRTATKYVGYLKGVQKALKVIAQGAVEDDIFEFTCASTGIMRWFEADDLFIVPKAYRVLFSDIIKSCTDLAFETKISFAPQVSGVNYAKKYATPEYYDKQEDVNIQGVSAVDLFADM